VFVAGQAALDESNGNVAGGDLADHTLHDKLNHQRALEDIGATWDDVVKSTVYTTQPHEYETIGTAMGEAMGDAAPPAQVIAGVTGLALPELLIEIELVVSLP
jgi:enamine deaminase RidA (YjgF/YER057c/UK114 family)